MLDKRLKILFSTAGLLLAGGLLAIVIVAASGGSTADTTGKAKLVLETNNFDFGDVSMAQGKVTKKIAIKNEGDADLVVAKLATSCMCTTAALEMNGKKSAAYGMAGHGGPTGFLNETIAPGQSGWLELVFDPNAHGPDAVGPIKRVVTITSNNGGEKGSLDTISFEGNVTK